MLRGPVDQKRPGLGQAQHVECELGACIAKIGTGMLSQCPKTREKSHLKTEVSKDQRKARRQDL